MHTVMYKTWSALAQIKNRVGQASVINIYIQVFSKPLHILATLNLETCGRIVLVYCNENNIMAKNHPETVN